MAHGAPPITFELLEKKSEEFDRMFKVPSASGGGVHPPIANNPFKMALTDARKHKLAQFAADSWPILDGSAKALLESFITLKKAHGSDLEKRVYVEQHIDSAEQLITRLLAKRPLVFFNPSDDYILREGFRGAGGFDDIHKKLSQKIPLDEYISYHEMQLAALLGVSTHTFFINSGSRSNSGRTDPAHSFTPEGIYTGLVGARFERPGMMEYAHMVIDRAESTPARGYGPHRTVDPLLDLWAEFYQSSFVDAAGRPYFPSYEELVAMHPNEHARHRIVSFSGVFFNVAVYIKRIECVLRPFFADADKRAAALGKKAFVHMVGLGLGVWRIHGSQQDFFLEATANVLRAGRFAHIGVIDFSYFDLQSFDGAHMGAKIPGTNITVRSTRRNPADPDVPADHLLVAMYAWDSNSYPGNEYWAHMYTASGDPAAACCSMITFLQNPLINPAIRGQNTFFSPSL